MYSRFNLLTIKDDKGLDYYGGDQDWYSSNSRAMAGCSSVAGANVLRSLARINSDCFKVIKQNNMSLPVKHALISSKCLKDDFLMLMTGVYETMKAFEIFPLNKIYDRKERNNKFFSIVKPNTGRSSIGFIQGVLLFAKKLGLFLTCNALPTAFVSKDVGLDFIKTGLEKSGAVVILTSYNKHSIKTYSPTYSEQIESGKVEKCPCGNANMKCHFATITGITDKSLIITTWGRIATIDIDELIDSWHSIKAWESSLFYFEPTPDRSKMYRALLMSPVPFIKGIVQAILRKSF